MSKRVNTIFVNPQKKRTVSKIIFTLGLAPDSFAAPYLTGKLPSCVFQCINTHKLGQKFAREKERQRESACLKRQTWYRHDMRTPDTVRRIVVCGGGGRGNKEERGGGVVGEIR